MEYFSADWHFQHKKMLEVWDDRPKNFQTLIIDSHVETLTDKDTLYCLGDMLFQQATRKKWFSHIMQLIPGKKILVRGNHDYKKQFPDAYWIEECGFEEVHELYTIINNKMLLSHFPMGGVDPARKDVRYHQQINELRKVFMENNCYIDIHGHTHLFSSPSKSCICVSVDQWDFKPADLNHVLGRYLQGKMKPCKQAK